MRAMPHIGGTVADIVRVATKIIKREIVAKRAKELNNRGSGDMNKKTTENQ